MLTRLLEIQKKTPTTTLRRDSPGELPPELRTQIYQEPLATPPAHAVYELITQGIRAERQNPNQPATPTTTFVHLPASCPTVLNTCRQIYLEARPVFYARASYYTANAKEFEKLIDLNHPRRNFPLRSNFITFLYVKDVVTYMNRGDYWLAAETRVLTVQLEEWKSLRKTYLCMRVGQEMAYIEFLLWIPCMAGGVIDFVDILTGSYVNNVPKSAGRLNTLGSVRTVMERAKEMWSFVLTALEYKDKSQ